MIVDAGSIPNSQLCVIRTNDAQLDQFSQTICRKSCEKNDQDASSLGVHNPTMPTTEASAVLSDWLQEALNEAGINQSQLGRAVGLTSQKVNRILSGTREMTAEELIRISAVLKAPIPSFADAKPYFENGTTADAERPRSFTKDYDRAFSAALEIEEAEFDGEMPLDEFIAAVTIGLKSQKRKR